MVKAKLMSAVITAAMVASVMAPTMPVFAAETVTNSVGSVAEDITNETKVGQDVAQEKQSEYYDAITEDAPTNAVNVYATIGSTYSVVIPKTIIIDGTSKTGAYSVKVSGDVAGDEEVKVVPDASFVMQQSGKADVTATVTQTKQAWSATEVAADTTDTGSLDAQDLSAGLWHGQFNFNIELAKVASVEP